VLLSTLLRLPFAAHPSHGPEFLFSLTPFRLDGLAVGALVAVVGAGRIRRALGHRVQWIAAFALSAGVVLHLGSESHTVKNLIRDFGAWDVVLFPLFVAIAFGSILIEAINGGRLARVLGTKALRSFRKYSYAIYVLHWPLNVLLWKYLPIRGLAWLFVWEALGISVSYFAGWASWVLLEKRILELKRYFPYLARRNRDSALDPVAAS
jgi:peptidoglycan/LPS O-acetylase OafA/YrhL